MYELVPRHRIISNWLRRLSEARTLYKPDYTISHRCGSLRMWSNHHSGTVFTSNPTASLWGDGSSNQNFTNYPGNAPYQYSQTLTPFLANPTPIISEGTAAPGEPTIPSTSVDQRVPPELQQIVATNKPRRSEPNTQPNQARSRKRVSQNPRYSASDWERHRSAIKELYIVRDLSLEETIGEMSAMYGFKPPLVLPNSLADLLLIII